MAMSNWFRQLLGRKDAKTSSRRLRPRARPRLELLESRNLLSVATSFVDDNWHFVSNNDSNPALSFGDTIRNDNDTINPGTITAFYGINGFGTVTGGPGPSSVAGSATINDAIANTDVSGTVNVLEGSYNELVSVSKTLTLLGAQHGVDARTGRPGAAESIIDGTGLGGAFNVVSNGVDIDGFTVQNVTTGVGANYNSGITAVGGGQGLFALNNIVQSVPIGIAPRGDSNQIQFNLIQNTTAGPAGQTGIYTDFGLSNTLIDSNKFVNNANASVILTGTAPGAVTGTTVSNNQGDNSFQFYYNTGTQVTGNTVTNSAGSGIVVGGGDTGITIMNNTVNGVGAGGFSGVRIADFIGGQPNSNVSVLNNVLNTGVEFGINVGAGGYTGTLNANFNSITGTAIALNNDDATVNVNASSNFWGTSNPLTVQGRIAGAGAANVDFTPLLDNNESVANQAVVGFQPDTTSVTVTALGAQTGATGRIQEGINVVTGAAPVVHIGPGTYAETVAANKAGLTLQGSTGVATDAVIQPTNVANNGVVVTADAITLRDLRITAAAQAIVASNLNLLTLANLQLDGNTSGGTLTNLNTVDFTASALADTIFGSGTQFSATNVQSIAINTVPILKLHGGAGNDIFQIKSNPGTTFFLDGGANDAAPTQTVTTTVGADSRSQTLPTGDTAVLDDSASAASTMYSVASGAVQAMNNRTVNFSNVESVSLTTTSAKDTVSVVGSPAPLTTINTNGGDVVFASGTAANSATVINGDVNGNTYSISGTGTGSVLQVNGGTGASTFNVTGTGANSGVTLNGNNAVDRFNISATGAGSLLSLNGGGGNDVFNIGSSGRIDNIGKVGINGGTGQDTLIVNDTAQTIGRTYLNSATAITRTDLANFSLSFVGLENMQESGGSGDDIMYLSSQAPGMVIGLYGNGGNDAFSILVYTNSGYTGVVTDGGSGTNNSLFVTDKSGGAVIHRFPKPFQPTGFVSIDYPTKPGSLHSDVQFVNMAQLVLNPNSD